MDSSGSERLNEMVGIFSGVIPAARSAWKKAILESPLIVFRIASGRASMVRGDRW